MEIFPLSSGVPVWENSHNLSDTFVKSTLPGDGSSLAGDGSTRISEVHISW